ncbi:hypothetical protein HC766_01795 [Candidatus Gracilibacteria bacterium]|nr:hypothetical protein [Candidatus Gracilibacteria bacterium]NJS41100.1 hypothetical protein [Candidatus Gracilibacteria bacterium]
MSKIHIKKDHALKWQLLFWAILATIYIIALSLEHPTAQYFLAGVIGSVYYIISRLIFGKHRLWQNFISAILLVIILDCLLPILRGTNPMISLYLFMNHFPIIVIMFLIDFFVEETLEIIEEVEEKVYKKNHLKD